MSSKQKAIVFFGSPHQNGYTARLLNAYLEERRFGEVQAFDCYRLKASPCTDCGYCKSHRACAFHELDGLYTALEQADVLIIAAPVYNLSFPAPLKAVLDRMQRYFNQRFVLGDRPPIARKKEGVLLVTAGNREDRGVQIMEEQCRMMFTVLNTTLTDVRTELGTDEIALDK